MKEKIIGPWSKWTILILFILVISVAVFSSISEKVRIENVSNLYKKIDETTINSIGNDNQPRICGLGLYPDMTSQMENPKVFYKSLYFKAPQDEVGDIRTFNAIDFTGESQEVKKIVARAERKGIHAYIYVDTTESFREEDLDEILFLFDNQIYPTNTEVFGPEPKPGIDGDTLITLLLLPINEPANVVGDIAGYFWSVNQFPKSQYSDSNEREMLYQDISRINRFGAQDAAGTIAHEFQHLIHWNHDRNEELWINEGLSEYAVFVNEFRLPNDPSNFLNNTDITLMSWSSHPRDYSRVFLWMLYLIDHYGGNSLARDIVANPANGLSALQNVINVRFPGVTIDEIFSNWILANFLDYTPGGGNLLGYPSLKLPPLRPTQTFGFLPVSPRTESVNTYAADYYLFSGGENLVLQFNGPDNEPKFKAKLIKLKANASPEILDFSLNSSGDGILPFPDFGLTFDQLVLIPYYFEVPDFNTITDYEFEAEGSGGPAAFTDTLQFHDQESMTIIAQVGLPSLLFDSEHWDSYAVRFTPPSDGQLLGAEMAVWRRVGTGGTVRFFVYDNSDDSLGVPGVKIDSVDTENVTGTPGFITWNGVDFSSKNIAVNKEKDFHIAWEFLNIGIGDTIFAILDTAKIATDRSSVFIRERNTWSHFVDGFNFFIRAIISVPADPTVPKLTAGILQNPVFSEIVDIFTIGENSLNPVSVEGTFTLKDSTHLLKFHAADDSNKVFIDDAFKLFDSGAAELVVMARHKFGTIAGTDTLQLNVNLIDFQRGGTISSADGNFQLILPPEAIHKPFYFTTLSLDDNFQLIKNYVALYDKDCTPTGLGYSVGPSGITFDKPVELTIRYVENDMAVLSENDLAVAYLEKDHWIVLGGELYRDDKSISVLVNRTGSYSLVVKNYEGLVNQDNIPNEFYLKQNYPNPFNPNTTIKFGLPKASHTILRIINLKGQIIATLIDEMLEAKEHAVEWDGTDARKVPVASGVYLYQIKAGDFIDTKKLVLVR
ncbi:MAG: T9SS type A sorting domain-containing protein [bacterium]